MKKLLSLVLAMTMIFCLALTSCNNQNNVEEDNTQNNVETTPLTEYNAYLEDLLAEYQPREALDKEVLATINGIPVIASAVRYANMAASSAFEGEGLSEEEMKTELENFYRQNAALVTLGQENDIKFTDEEIANNIVAYINQMKQQYGEEYDAVFADSPFTKYFYYLYYSIYSPLFSKLNDVYFEDKDSEIAKTARTQVLDYYTANNFVRAKHILIQFPAGEGEDGALTDAQKAETLLKANVVLDKVNAMADISEFDALIEEYNEDPGMQANPAGYYFGKGEMVPEFEEAAYALEEGKTSGLVETSYGYHILLKLPIDDEALTESSDYYSAFSNEFGNYLVELGNSYEIVYFENHDARAKEFVEEYKALLAGTDAEAEKTTD